jgi:hypothetical protein
MILIISRKIPYSIEESIILINVFDVLEALMCHLLENSKQISSTSIFTLLIEISGEMRQSRKTNQSATFLSA